MLLNSLSIEQLYRTANYYSYYNPDLIRNVILEFWVDDIMEYEKQIKYYDKKIKSSFGIWNKLKSCFGLGIDVYKYYDDDKKCAEEEIKKYKSKLSFLMSNEFINNLTGNCSICLETMNNREIVIPDCLHPICVECFILLCKNEDEYKCPIRCNNIKYIYPVIIKNNSEC